jgi:hypothetical protein
MFFLSQRSYYQLYQLVVRRLTLRLSARYSSTVIRGVTRSIGVDKGARRVALLIQGKDAVGSGISGNICTSFDVCILRKGARCTRAIGRLITIECPTPL